jgi:hypothetical protein
MTVFERTSFSIRPDSRGRLKVLARCAIADCQGTARISILGSDRRGGRRFRFSRGPVARFQFSKVATLTVRVPMTKRQRALTRKYHLNAVYFVVDSHDSAGHKKRLLTDGLFCTRETPCDSGAAPR